jgi:hypothetical protein
MEAVAKILGQQYTKAQEEALKHAQANLAIMSNKFTMLKADVFDNGFDTGLTTFLKEMNSALDGAGFKNLGATIGEGFRKAFAGATMLGKAIIDLREPLAEVLKTLGTFALAVSGVSLLAGAFTLLTSPLGALAALATLVATQWDNLAATFRKAALGATEAYALINGLVSGKGWDESKRLAALAGGEYLQKQAGAQAGENYAESFLARAKALFASVPGLNLDKFNAEWNRLLKESSSTAFKGVSDYNANATRQDEILLRRAEHAAELSNKLKTLREQLLPTTAAFDKLREVLGKVESMRGKKIGGHAIADSELDRMAAAAKENAFNSAFPAASRIRDLADAVRIDSEALAASGGNRDLMREEKQFLQERLALKRKGVDLTNEESAALRSLIHAQSELNKRDGLTAWAESQKSGMDSINSSIGHALDTVADGLAKIATEGKNIKATMRDMLRSIAADLIRNGIRSMMAEGIRGLNLSSVFGGAGDSVKAALGLGDSVVSKAQAAVDDAAKSLSSTTTPLMNVEATVVNLNGASISGLDSFRPGSSIQDAIRPEGVGGVLPRNDNGSPLFSNALPDFKGGLKVGGLGSIPSNSVAEFGKGLVTSLGALPGFKDALKTSADGITKNSVAAFGNGLQRLAPVAQQAGITPISGSLAEMYKRAGLDKATESALRTVNPDLQAVMLRAQELSGMKIRANSIMGHRTAEEQHKLFLQNRPGHWVTSKDGYNSLSNHQSGNAMDMTFADSNGRLRWGQPGEYERFNSYVQQAARERGVNVGWGGNWKGHKDWDHWELTGKGASGKSADLGKTLGDESRKAAEEIKKQIASTRSLTTEAQKSFQGLAQTSGQLTHFDSGLGDLAGKLQEGIPAADGFGSQLQKLIEQLLSGLGGGGSGGGLLSGAGELLGGLFEEGGYSDSAVSSAAMPASFWAGAPHYAEGTPNTSGGIPAVLHDNEAVVPLSRGRSIPVELKGEGVGGDNQRQAPTINIANNIHAKDVDSFRRSTRQVAYDMHRLIGRAAVRNG